MTTSGKSPFRTILALDTTRRDQTFVGVITEKETIIKERGVKAQEVDKLIAEALSAAEISLGDIKVVAVNNKAGSLTGVRIGVTVANTLAWDKRLPIIEFEGEDFQECLKNLRNWSEDKYVKIAAVTS